VTARAPGLAEARERAYGALACLELPGGHYRHDIARAAARAAVPDVLSPRPAGVTAPPPSRGV